MTVRFRNPDAIITLPVKFEGHARDAELDVELSLPLGKLKHHSVHEDNNIILTPGLPSLSPTSTGSGSLNIMEPRSHTIICKGLT